MTLDDLIRVASDAYPDDCVWRCYKDTDPVGDTLADFIARELADTFDETASDADKLEEAIRAMKKAQDELGDVVEALEYEHDERS